MPELPEVETIRRDLTKKVIGRKITGVKIMAPKIIKNPSAQKFAKLIRNKTIKEIKRRGKYLLLLLDSEEYLIIHLKLTGVLIYLPRITQSRLNSPKELRVVFCFSGKQGLLFNDRRKFGEIYLLKDPGEIKGIAKLGPEPLSKEFTLRRFQTMVQKKNVPIKTLLMDQSFIAGIGNIYANESLYLSDIAPQRKSSSLSEKEIITLYHSLKDLLKEAIRLRGTSVDSYRDLKAKKGNFGKRLLVYGRAGQFCCKCKAKIVRQVISGRGTFFCPLCQK